MRKGDVIILEDNDEEVTLLNSIGKKDKDGQFWEVKKQNGDTDILLLKFKNKEGNEH
jgi:hypothetical protein